MHENRKDLNDLQVFSQLFKLTDRYVMAAESQAEETT
jgi:hypothetical protein